MNPALIVMIRTDMTSMNPGKMAAQACHGATMLEAQAGASKSILHEKWRNSTPDSFGTTLVMAIPNEKTLRSVQGYLNIRSSGEVEFWGTIHDPTYPVRDGEVTHFISIDTGVFVFLDLSDSLVYQRLKEDFGIKLMP